MSVRPSCEMDKVPRAASRHSARFVLRRGAMSSTRRWGVVLGCVAMLTVGCGRRDGGLVGGEIEFEPSPGYDSYYGMGEPDAVTVRGAELFGRVGEVSDVSASSSDTRVTISWASRELLDLTLEREGASWGAMTQLVVWGDVLGEGFAPGTTRSLSTFGDESMSGIGCTGPELGSYDWDVPVEGANVTVTEGESDDPESPPPRVLHFTVFLTDQSEPAHATVVVQ